jgi:hypothetical protein
MGPQKGTASKELSAAIDSGFVGSSTNVRAGDAICSPIRSPNGERPIDGRYPVGEATARTRPPYAGYGYGYYGRPWYYRPAAFYGYAALGLGYFYYDATLVLLSYDRCAAANCWEKKVANHLGFLHLQFAIIALRAARVIG